MRRSWRRGSFTSPTSTSAGTTSRSRSRRSRRLVEESRPELVVASGDLTHRGLRSQHERAAAFLRGLELPLLAIPGNHDIPYTFPKRFTRPWQEFERQWGETEPVYRSETASSPSASTPSGRGGTSRAGCGDEQIERAAERAADAPD